MFVDDDLTLLYFWSSVLISFLEMRLMVFWLQQEAVLRDNTVIHEGICSNFWIDFEFRFGKNLLSLSYTSVPEAGVHSNTISFY